MLHTDTHSLMALDTQCQSRSHFAGKNRVLGVILKSSTAKGIAVDVHTRSQPDGNAKEYHLFTHSFTDLLQERYIPSLRQKHFHRPCGGVAINRFAGDLREHRFHASSQCAPVISFRDLCRSKATRGQCLHALNDIHAGRSIRKYHITDALVQQCSYSLTCCALNVQRLPGRILQGATLEEPGLFFYRQAVEDGCFPLGFDYLRLRIVNNLSYENRCIHCQNRNISTYLFCGSFRFQQRHIIGLLAAIFTPAGNYGIIQPNCSSYGGVAAAVADTNQIVTGIKLPRSSPFTVTGTIGHIKTQRYRFGCARCEIR